MSVEVKVLIDKAQAGNQYADDEKLEESGIEVRRDKAGGLMHNKFCVVDYLMVYTGSYNHTDSATQSMMKTTSSSKTSEYHISTRPSSRSLGKSINRGKSGDI